ncbi:hypothetical protein EMGBS4_05060 [Acidimicrobiaceae bacterium]|nr:hypothetical protein EMGBS4_05060 [Acidimicrobiaceae bacterium]
MFDAVFGTEFDSKPFLVIHRGYASMNYRIDVWLVVVLVLLAARLPQLP